MNRTDRLVSDETELGREKEHIRNALQVNAYPDWMLADSWVSDQLDPGQEEGAFVIEGEEEEKEVEQIVPATTMEPEVPCVPVAKKKCTVVLPCVQEISEQLRRVFRSFDILPYFKLTNTLQQLLVWSKYKVEKEKVVGPVYHITCDATYVGNTERSLKTRFLECWRKCSVGSNVSQHVHMDRLEHGVILNRVKVLTVENRKFERGCKGGNLHQGS